MSKVWLITGFSSGLGRLVAEKALERGDRVVGTSRRAETLAGKPVALVCHAPGILKPGRRTAHEGCTRSAGCLIAPERMARFAGVLAQAASDLNMWIR
jgi:NAD(P)-dependent dehydrogenase (short-subunit alcohol dehydrogenase family)